MTMAYGFGSQAKGGFGGDFHLVTNLHDDGSKGTLRWCLEHTPPFVVRSNIRGIIPLQGNIVMNQPCVTLDLPGITLTQWGLVVRDKADDTIIRNLTVNVGANEDWNRDGITIYGTGGPIRRVLVDRCTFKGSPGKNAVVWGNWSDVTFQNCLIADSLYQGAGLGFISGGICPENGTRRMTLYRCVLDNGSRNPQFQGPSRVDMINCVAKWKSYGTVIAPDDNGTPHVSLIGNMYLPGTATLSLSRKPICFGSTEGMQAGAVYVMGNWWAGNPLRGWDMVGDPVDNAKVASVVYRHAFKWPTPKEYACPVEAAGAELAERVMREAGAPK